MRPRGSAETANRATRTSFALPEIRRTEMRQAELCRSCGACCAFSREWPRFTTEDEAELDRIPRELVAEDGTGMRCTGDRCGALRGEVGMSTSCAVYDVRPDVCRACEPGDEACLMARQRFGLPLPG